MAEKLYEYQGCIGWLHGFKDNLKEKYSHLKENGLSCLNEKLSGRGEIDVNSEDFSHLYRRKTRKELVRISAAVMGIEFSYAAETAFVSPTLLKIGVEHKHMTLVWALSPLIGFFLTPILGSLSDRCHLSFGRRRPFILAMSLGVFLGLILVPNGEYLGYAMGDPRPSNKLTKVAAHKISASSKSVPITSDMTRTIALNETEPLPRSTVPSHELPPLYHSWGVFFTILGTVLLDFDADGCQSPARAYLLDVTVPEDHARGLSTFTIMAGLGGFFGYALGGINWDVTFIGKLLGGHVRAVFTLITVIFVVCVTYTVTSFKEIPLGLLELKADHSESIPFESSEEGNARRVKAYGTLKDDTGEEYDGDSSYQNIQNGDQMQEPLHQVYETPRKSIAPNPNASFLIYLQSIIYMPHSIRMLCLTNLFCWMAHVCYSLYFTDFVGEAVYLGNPVASEGTVERELYESGVRFGCWGMSMYSLSCACYSSVIETFITMFGARRVYVGGLLVYSTGMFLMAVSKHVVGVILFSWTAGVMYSTLFTMPYLILAHYHSTGVVSLIRFIKTYLASLFGKFFDTLITDHLKGTKY
ncbi:unnamed protein product [Acanthoscelides obtectus]|uniref:Proton-associated sugar transporter A n=1 Tax=Acanthoscelides obtectus TaxID=200917 RepID=A0A9P0L539_ACAOB|nr:unnamed protein product [Acanthoscelides obtectus]CAK1632772.1 Membrane-associated transporter protein [Acanthoscelides obtectus]